MISETDPFDVMWSRHIFATGVVFLWNVFFSNFFHRIGECRNRIILFSDTVADQHQVFWSTLGSFFYDHEEEIGLIFLILVEEVTFRWDNNVLGRIPWARFFTKRLNLENGPIFFFFFGWHTSFIICMRSFVKVSVRISNCTIIYNCAYYTSISSWLLCRNAKWNATVTFARGLMIPNFRDTVQVVKSLLFSCTFIHNFKGRVDY